MGKGRRAGELVSFRRWLGRSLPAACAAASVTWAVAAGAEAPPVAGERRAVDGAEEHSAEARTAEARTADERTADERTADERTADERSADERSADERSADDAERAEQLYRRGSQAFEAGRYGEAMRTLEQAFTRYPTYRIACTLGQVELHLEQFASAAQHLDYCARNFPDSAPRRVLRRVVDGLADARQQVFTLGLRSNVGGARLLLDGEAVATTPIETDLFVEPGKHTLSVVKAGYVSYRAEVYFPAGGQKDFQVTLSERDGASRASSDANQRGARQALLLGGGALTLAGVTSGVVLRLLAAEAGREAEATSRFLRAQSQPCDAAPSLGCRELQRRHERSARHYQVSNIAFLSAAGVALGTIAVAALLGDAGADERRAGEGLSVALTGGVGDAGLGVSGVF